MQFHEQARNLANVDPLPDDSHQHTLSSESDDDDQLKKQLKKEKKEAKDKKKREKKEKKQRERDKIIEEFHEQVGYDKVDLKEVA